jgi:hypothetical protein
MQPRCFATSDGGSHAGSSATLHSITNPMGSHDNGDGI